MAHPRPRLVHHGDATSDGYGHQHPRDPEALHASAHHGALSPQVRTSTSSRPGGLACKCSPRRPLPTGTDINILETRYFKVLLPTQPQLYTPWMGVRVREAGKLALAIDGH
jgi:hypothetical protein